MKSTRQLSLLLWKNYKLQKRRPIATLFQLGLPILFILIILLIRVLKVKREHIEPTVWPTFNPERLPYHRLGKMQWKLAFAPSNEETRSIMDEVRKKLKVIPRGFASETEMTSSLVQDQNKGAARWEYLAGVTFLDYVKPSLKYKIRMPSSLRNSKNKTSKFSSFQPGSGTWETKSVFPRTFGGIGPRSNKSKSGGPPDYFREGFLAVQFAVDHAFTKYVTNQTLLDLDSNMTLTMQRFPYPAYLRDPFVIAIQNTLPLLLMLSLVYNALLTVKGIVYEKENRLKVSMGMKWLRFVLLGIKQT